MDDFCDTHYGDFGIWSGTSDCKPEMGIYAETGKGIGKNGEAGEMRYGKELFCLEEINLPIPHD